MEQRNVILWSRGGSRGSAFISSSPTAIFTRHHTHLWWCCPAWLCVCTRAPMMQWLLNRKASCVLHRQKPSPISHVLAAGSKWQRQPSLYCLVTMVRSWLGSNSIEQGRRHLRASSREERERQEGDKSGWEGMRWMPSWQNWPRGINDLVQKIRYFKVQATNRTNVIVQGVKSTF